MQTEMENRKRRDKYLISIPCLVLFRVALRLSRGYAVSELFDTKAAILYSLSGILWLYELIWWIRERREEKKLRAADEDGDAS